jgi:hypothetical protein
MNALVAITQPALPVSLTATLELAADFAKASKSPNTIAAYQSDWRIFTAWCSSRALECLPAAPTTIAAPASIDLGAAPGGYQIFHRGRGRSQGNREMPD